MLVKKIFPPGELTAEIHEVNSLLPFYVKKDPICYGRRKMQSKLFIKRELKTKSVRLRFKPFTFRLLELKVCASIRVIIHILYYFLLHLHLNSLSVTKILQYLTISVFCRCSSRKIFSANKIRDKR